MTFEVHLVRVGDRTYVEGPSGKPLIENEHDAVDLIGICGEYETSRILFFAENLSDRFFDLKSGHAGMILQKLSNYHIKAALVISPDLVRSRFDDFMVETNRGNQFRVFFRKAEAQRWLLRDENDWPFPVNSGRSSS